MRDFRLSRPQKTKKGHDGHFLGGGVEDGPPLAEVGVCPCGGGVGRSVEKDH